MQGSYGFITTQWDRVWEAAGQDERAFGAKEQFCRDYWLPLYAFLRRLGRSPEDAQDLTQGFLSSLIHGDLLKKASLERGSLRTYLIRALKNFATDDWRRANRQKRAPEAGWVSLGIESENDYQQHLIEVLTPERAYHRRWALLVIDRAFAKLQGEYEARQRVELFRRLQATLLSEPDATDHADTAQALRMSVAAVKSEMSRMRARLRDLIRAEIRPTVVGEAGVDLEYQALIEAVGR